MAFLLVLLYGLSDFVFAGEILPTNPSDQRIEINGKAYEVSDNGIATPFNGILNLEDTGVSTDVKNPLGNFTMVVTVPNSKGIEAGSRVTITPNDPDLFVLSPFSGNFYLPNIKASEQDKLHVRLVRKYSRLYLTLTAFDESYSVQVLTTNNEGGAIDTVNMLNGSGKLTGGYSAYYESHLRSGMPKNGYFYKVKIGFFPKKEDADAMRDAIRKMGDQFVESFVTANVKFYQ